MFVYKSQVIVRPYCKEAAKPGDQFLKEFFSQYLSSFSLGGEYLYPTWKDICKK